jgi:hypothetical protein
MSDASLELNPGAIAVIAPVLALITALVAADL